MASPFDPAKVIRNQGGMLAATGAIAVVGSIVAAREAQKVRNGGRIYQGEIDEDLQIASSMAVGIGALALVA